MPASINVLTAINGAAEADVVLALCAPGSGITVTRRCGDVVELLGAAQAGAGAVAVVSGDLPGLDRERIAQLHQEGVRIVALGGDDPKRLRAIGIDAVIDDARAEKALATAVLAAIYNPEVDPLVVTPAIASVSATGQIITVWGPGGAPGRSTVAVEVAAELAGLARRGGRGRAARRRISPGPALLIDADTYGSSLALRLGLLDDASGIALACRQAGQGSLGADELARLAPLVAPGLRVLTGIARAGRWPEVPSSGLAAVFETARTLVPWTVIDVAAPIEADEVLMYDTHAPQRNAAALTALAAADVVVMVGGADPLGIARLVRGLDELREAPVAVSAPVTVVVNRVRTAAVGPRPERAIRETLRRYAGCEDLLLIPEDAPALDEATLAGRTLAEHAPASPIREAIATLVTRFRGEREPT